ncbi:MAG TPA: precorrin-8X methylmutase [Geobacteraceae bacterium]|nr:precorrin-8X methylmutase [Geobacteraceae bacterium]
MSVHLRPEEIEAESFRIIDAEAGTHQWPPAEWQVIRRVIHTSADFDYCRTIHMSDDAIASGVAALKGGEGLVTDTNMALAGINKQKLALHAVTVACFIADPQVAQKAADEGITRSIVAMRRATADGGNGIFVIGNAPTALFELLRQVREEGVRPSLVVGFPVGFVGAAESKEELITVARAHNIPYITARGRKGGSNVAAAVINALLILAGESR